MSRDTKGKSRFYKNLKVIKLILDAINLIEYNLDHLNDEKEWHFNVGQLEALKTFYNKPLKSIYDEIKIVNQELADTLDDEELYETHKQYLNGYHLGCLKIIQHHKSSKDLLSDIRILTYVRDEGLKELLITLFSIVGFEIDDNLEKDSTVCVSTDIDRLNKLADTHDTFKFVVTMAQNNNAATKFTSDENRLIQSIKNDLSTKYSLKHSREDTLLDAFKLLNDEWLDANFVYLQSLMSVEQVFALMISSMKQKY